MTINTTQTRGLVFKETVVLHQRGSKTQNRIDKVNWPPTTTEKLKADILSFKC